MLLGLHLPPGTAATEWSPRVAAAREALLLFSVPAAEALQFSAVSQYKKEVQFNAVVVARAVERYPEVAARKVLLLLSVPVAREAAEVVPLSVVSPAKARAQPRAVALGRVAAARAKALPRADNF